MGVEGPAEDRVDRDGVRCRDPDLSALAFELVDEAVQSGGLMPTVVGFLAGALNFVGSNILLARAGVKHRKRSGQKHPSEKDAPGSGTAIALGALIDGIPESVVLGLGLVAAGTVSPAMLAAVFISNVPEGLSSTAGMKKAGRSPGYVFGVWTAIAVFCGFAPLIGFTALENAPAELSAEVTGRVSMWDLTAGGTARNVSRWRTDQRALSRTRNTDFRGTLVDL
jgi:ZIP family zinc transporter